MRLATTALEDYWLPDGEGLVFLHEGCRLWSRRTAWEPLQGRVLPSPWDAPGAVEAGVAACRSAYEEVLTALAVRLDEVHGTGGGVPYWRVVAGPTLLGLVAHTHDRRARIAAARERWPGIASARLTALDLRTPLDSAQDHAWRYTDLYNLHLTTQLLGALGVEGPERPWSGAPLPPSPARPGRARLAAAAAWSMFRPAVAPTAAFSHLQIPRAAAFRLLAASGARALPVFCETPAALLVEAGDGEARRSLSALPVAGELARTVAAALPRQFPASLLEGFRMVRRHALAGWRDPPRALLTATGWFLDDAFKVLAAETKAAGGRLVVVQHGGAYGALAALDMERHERSIADEYWTWGWEEPPGEPDRATVRPMPHPTVSVEAGAAAGLRPDASWSLVSTSPTRHPYSWYLANLTGWDHFEEYLDWRRRFFAALSGPALARGEARLHPADEGWSHRERLRAEFPGIRFDESGEPWLPRHRRLAVAVIDHPQTSLLESLAADLPTLLFWNPARWLLRPSAVGPYEALRRAGVLHDSPESAAAALERALTDGGAWWRTPAIQEARASFCARYARGAAGWHREWAARLNALAD